MKININMEMLVIALLLVLVIVSGVQAFQLVNLKTSGGIVASSSDSSSSKPASVQQAPAQMVGGC